MSPRIVFCLTLAGVLAAGVPLWHLTGRSAAPSAAVDSAPADAEPGEVRVWMSIRYTGTPELVKVVCGGRDIVRCTDNTEGAWEGEVMLPTAGLQELEVLACWPESAAEGVQAVGVSITPPGRGETSDTQWTFPGETELHSVYTFTPKQL